MNRAEDLAVLDRYIISKNQELNEGQTFTVKVTDGYIIIASEFNEDTGERRIQTYFSEFDGQLDISFIPFIDSELETEGVEAT